MSYDTDLAANVSDELFWDPKVDNTAIAVSANDGTITLRGTVGNLREKREAQKAAQRVIGVVSVDNKLQVKLMNDQKRVTLTGTVDWQYQRDEAEFVASNIVGALDLFDEIELTHPTPKSGDVKESIKSAFKRNAALDAGDLHVSTDNGTVTIKGTVSSWAQHDEAIDAAWAAPGVTAVYDDMTVAY